jgi:formate hydrogenlyase subunit 3/multisubunit Na+/H+ antiporter MnhD subunit
MGKTLIVVGLLIAAVGVVMSLGFPLGRLPGDFTYRRDSFSFYFPLTTSILVSIVLTLVAWFLGRR